MFRIILFSTLLCAFASALPLTIAEDEEGVQYLVLPLSREKRQTTYDISKGPQGTTVQLGHKGTIFDDGSHKVTGAGSISKTFNPNSPPTFGGNLGYSHEASGSGLNLGVQKTPGYGTDLGVEGRYNIWREGKATVDAVGSYNRHYGGQFGTTKPNWYGGVEVSIPF
ncbi:hypothetical protein WA026_009744 [Henosepilachna vigintioctopunctata]|uniref:Attacin C-terminal domain-containing protein n=1 Tax=Henosepilachna vigintioctopunctata TaxID=420089 RepID=A0AAW1TK69_9CUCU